MSDTRTFPWKALLIIALCWAAPTVNSFGVDPSCRRRRPFSPFVTHGGFDSVRQNRNYCNGLIIRPWKDDSTTTIRTAWSFSLSAGSAQSEADASNHPSRKKNGDSASASASGSPSKGEKKQKIQ
eukprot:scaffold45954_cov31-Attheya_sp.AAC.1